MAVILALFGGWAYPLICPFTLLTGQFFCANLFVPAKKLFFGAVFFDHPC
jgi:hypothetical protein